MWQNWSPLGEITRALSTCFVGPPLGTLLILVIGGFLSESFGWVSVFYFSTTCNVIWTVIWLVLIRNSPEEHPFISESEKSYIMKNRTQIKKTTKFAAPFKEIFLSVPFWAIIMAHWAKAPN